MSMTMATPDLSPDQKRPERVVALTMVRDEADMLPRWIAYYGRQLGVENLIVLDDGSVDGSVDDLPCPVIRLPPEPWKAPWSRTRRNLANRLSAGLLACYDVAIFTDADEFLIPDPARYEGLTHYLSANCHRNVCAPLAVNVLHNPDVEPSFDPGTAVLAQRRFVKFAPGMCKPLIKRIAADWRVGGFHGIVAPYEIDRDLLMAHLKYYDITALEKVAEQRYLRHQSGRGHEASAWALTSDELMSRLRTWVASPAGVAVPDFDPQEPDLSKVITIDRDVFRSRGSQLRAMATSPLRLLPERFSTVL